MFKEVVEERGVTLLLVLLTAKSDDDDEQRANVEEERLSKPKSSGPQYETLHDSILPLLRKGDDNGLRPANGL